MSLSELRRHAEHYFGPRGRWAYDAFADVNARFFDGALPVPLLIWTLTPHGRCLGWTLYEPSRPTIALHPSILEPKSGNPWGLTPDVLGPAYAYDVVLHECLHVRVGELGGWHGHGTSSHNCDPWVAEVNRIAPLLGYDLKAGRSRPKRHGKKVVRETEGDVGFAAVATFPYGFRHAAGDLARYTDPKRSADVPPLERD